jgi:hypothetical protein
MVVEDATSLSVDSPKIAADAHEQFLRKERDVRGVATNVPRKTTVTGENSHDVHVAVLELHELVLEADFNRGRRTITRVCDERNEVARRELSGANVQ